VKVPTAIQSQAPCAVSAVVVVIIIVVIIIVVVIAIVIIVKVILVNTIVPSRFAAASASGDRLIIISLKADQVVLAFVIW